MRMINRNRINTGGSQNETSNMPTFLGNSFIQQLKCLLQLHQSVCPAPPPLSLQHLPRVGNVNRGGKGQIGEGGGQS